VLLFYHLLNISDNVGWFENPADCQCKCNYNGFPFLTFNEYNKESEYRGLYWSGKKTCRLIRPMNFFCSLISIRDRDPETCPLEVGRGRFLVWGRLICRWV